MKAIGDDVFAGPKDEFMRSPIDLVPVPVGNEGGQIFFQSYDSGFRQVKSGIMGCHHRIRGHGGL
jgi:hypothetical protein